jgi:hypothetical protein
MARLLENISSESFQRHVIIFQESEITLKLRFLPGVEQWFFDAEYKGFSIKGKKLAVGVLHMQSSNQPFDFVVTDNSGSNLDPYRADDFSLERLSLFLLEPDDMEDVRGVSVQI